MLTQQRQVLLGAHAPVQNNQGLGRVRGALFGSKDLLQFHHHRHQTFALVLIAFKHPVRQFKPRLVKDHPHYDLGTIIALFLGVAPLGLGIAQRRAFKITVGQIIQ